jgi:hypothetical protein
MTRLVGPDALAPSTVEQADLSDLDLLDDERRHGRCTRCYARNLPLGTPFTAFCGVRTVWWAHGVKGVVPPNVCPDCRTLTACVTCGGSRSGR